MLIDNGEVPSLKQSSSQASRVEKADICTPQANVDVVGEGDFNFFWLVIRSILKGGITKSIVG